MSHESDSVVGITNKLLFRMSDDVLVSFPYSRYKAKLVGNPVRDFDDNPKNKKIKLKGGCSVLFFMGGSQGAVQLNDLVFEILGRLLEKYEVIHQTGDNSNKGVEYIKDQLSPDAKKLYHQYNFMDEDEIHQAYFDADIIISRAGSGSLFEIASSGKSSILVPLDSAASDHQRNNAFIYEKKGACVVIDPKDITEEKLYKEIEDLMGDKDKMSKMGKNAKSFAMPKASEDIKDIILQYDEEKRDKKENKG